MSERVTLPAAKELAVGNDDVRVGNGSATHRVSRTEGPARMMGLEIPVPPALLRAHVYFRKVMSFIDTELYRLTRICTMR